MQERLCLWHLAYDTPQYYSSNSTLLAATNVDGGFCPHEKGAWRVQLAVR